MLHVKQIGSSDGVTPLVVNQLVPDLSSTTFFYFPFFFLTEVIQNYVVRFEGCFSEICMVVGS